MAQIRISGEEMQCLWVIFRKTYGWHKKEDAISLSQFVDYTNLKKTHISRALYRLIDKNVIIKKDNSISIYQFNKDFDTWKPLPKKIMTFIKESSLKNYCYICGYKETIHHHHIIPRNEGGSNKVSNLVNLCPNCHSLAHKNKYNSEMLLSKKITVENVIQKDNGFQQNELKPLSKKVHTKETIQKKLLQKKPILSDEDFLLSLKEKFTWVDFDEATVKMDAWLMTKPGRKKTRGFIVNWLNRIEKPMEIKTKPKIEGDYRKARDVLKEQGFPEDAL